MSADRAFIDTNIFIYLYSDNADDLKKRHLAYKVMEQYDCQISTQVINEFSNICIKKLKITINQIQGFIIQMCSYCDLAYIDEDTIDKALGIHAKYGYAYYDSLMVASALERGCIYLLSEDLADGQVIEGLTIKNIFL